MPESPAPKFAAYPRNDGSRYGTADKLEALGKGYFGLNLVFLINVVIAVASNSVIQGDLTRYTWVAGAMFLLIGGLSFPSTKCIGIGKGWPEWGAIVASILLGLNSALFCGIVGFIVMLQIASSEMKKYGLDTKLLSVNKGDFEQILAARRANEKGR